MNKKTLFVLSILFSVISATAQIAPSALFKQLKALKDVVSVEVHEPDANFLEQFTIMYSQPLDHKDPSAGTYNQRIFFKYKGKDRPVVLITTGYPAKRNTIDDATKLLDANQISVEHRFHGQSVPEGMPWKYLNSLHVTADLHRSRLLFNNIFDEKTKWINTGFSKGGMTTLRYKMDYPEDTDVTIAVGAPIIFERNSPVVEHFFDTISTKSHRQKITNFQRLVLERKNELLPLFEWYAKGKKWKFTPESLEKGLELTVFEYEFAFWQYSDADFSKIPSKDASANEILTYLHSISKLSFLQEPEMAPVSHIHATELGSYNYNYAIKKFKNTGLLSADKYRGWTYTPDSVEALYDNSRSVQNKKWLQEKGNNIIYLHGSYDPYSAPRLQLIPGKTNAAVFMKAKGNHLTAFLSNFKGQQHADIVSKLEKWLDMKIVNIKNK